MTRGSAVAILMVAVLAAGAVAFALAPAPPAAVTVRNLNGPPVSVEFAGVRPVTVDCPGYQTIRVPRRNLVPGDVVVADARTGVVLREVSIWGDVELLVRGRTVVVREPDPVPFGPPGSCL